MLKKWKAVKIPAHWIFFYIPYALSNAMPFV